MFLPRALTAAGGRRKPDIRISYEDWLLACFLAGVAAGTGVTLIFGQESLGAALFTGKQKDVGTLFRLRLSQMMTGWLAGLTVCSRFLFGLLTFYAGMCLSASLAVLTLQRGIWGIVSFIPVILPHGIFYVFVWRVLSMWAGGREKKIHLAGGLLLLTVLSAGIYIEGMF